MPNPFEVVIESSLEMQDSIQSPYELLEVDDGESAVHEAINGRRADFAARRGKVFLIVSEAKKAGL